MSDVILSIKPEFTNQILLGNKTIELRKKVGKKFFSGSVIYIYSSTPKQAIVGKMTLSKLEFRDVDSIAQDYSHDACVGEQYIRSYYRGADNGFMLMIKDVITFADPIPLAKLRTYGFHPPQSFCYAQGAILELLRRAQ
ncbi:hypothetical protein JKP23_09555 [Vibrio vulnificus]|uniref:hypothetical protein n=1 Tax=Vibrio vulnificus TaxID=672 RepID=UPI001CDB7C9B|nr:hypothetical protein [Vibrio vulnificus]MCA3897344.1 hypothetical protein [Vibrio vulnificus]MCU8462172.1 hypothetical protein [Vibrio vulnificus]